MCNFGDNNGLKIVQADLGLLLSLPKPLFLYAVGWEQCYMYLGTAQLVSFAVIPQQVEPCPGQIHFGL